MLFKTTGKFRSLFISMTALHPMSLKSKLIAVIVGLFVAFIWVLAFVSVTVLQSQVSHVLFDQQFAATQRIAGELDNKLKDRVESLAKIAGNVPTDLHEKTLDAYLAQFGGLHIAFSAGISVIGLDGRTIADYPVVQGRRGTYFGDRDYFRQALATRKPYIDKPIIGRALKRPVLTISVPIFDGAGRVRAVMTGITDLTAPNFLGPITNRTLTGKSDFFIVSPQDNLIVAATDSKRAMTKPPVRGINAMYDRFVDGVQGSGISVSSEGDPKLYSSAQVPTARWIVMAALPTEVAFRPVKTMQRYLYIVAAAMTLLALLTVQWVGQRMLRPLEDAGQAMLRMTEGSTPLVPLPIKRNDEIGRLIANFNLLITDRQRYEAALADSQQRFRALVENSPDVICRFDRDARCVYANPAMERAIGSPCDAIIGKTFEEVGLPTELASTWMVSIKKVFLTHLMDTFEFSLPNASSGRYYQARLVPEFGAGGGVSNVLAVARDISVIKGGEAVLRESEQRLHGITANIPGMVFQCVLRARDGALLFTYVSDGSQALLGVMPGQVQANRHAIPEALTEKDRATFFESLQRSARTMEVWNWEGCAYLAGDEEKWLNCRATPRDAGDGDIVWEGVMFNITNSKRGEQEIQQSKQLLRELSAHMEHVREEERKRIAREVHDELGQALTVLRMDVSLLRLNFGGQSPQLMERIQSMKSMVDRTIRIARHITSTLRPAALDLGLIAAIEWLVEEFIDRTGIDCVLDTEGQDVLLDDNRATALFRIVQESLTNVVKHAEASQVRIVIRTKDERVWLEISDNGKGFSTQRTRKAGSFGLIGMRERALMLGGEVDVQSAVGKGTRVAVSIPLAA